MCQVTRFIYVEVKEYIYHTLKVLLIYIYICVLNAIKEKCKIHIYVIEVLIQNRRF